MEHKSIQFILWLRRLLPKEEKESKGGDKEPDLTNPEDLPKYIQLFIVMTLRSNSGYNFK